MRRRLTLGLLTLALLPLVAACQPKAKPTLVRVDSAIYQSVRAIHETAVVLGQAQVITPDQELQLQKAILPVAQLGEQATRVLASWTGGATPPELQALVREMGGLAQQVVLILPQNDAAKAALMEKVVLAQQAIAAVLLILASGGIL